MQQKASRMHSALLVALVDLAVVCQADWRVINGKDAIMYEFPWMVSIKFGGSDHFCGGTLINKRTVLTAAHCVFTFRFFTESKFQRNQIVAVMGEHQLNKVTGKERIVQIKKVIIPSPFNNPKAFMKGNDIALVRLACDVIPEDHIKMATIPIQDREPSVPGQTCTVVGWGSLQRAGKDTSNILQKANLKIVSNKDCDRSFNYTSNNPSKICAGSGYSTTSACLGDSGGPLFCKQGSGYVQVGIVSYGQIPCGRRGIPTVFTRVSNFGRWIRNNL